MYEVTSILDALYVEADAYENYTYRKAYKDAIEDVEDAIKSLPSDALAESSEVVRCKDCQHGHKQIEHNGELFYECDLSECEEWFTDDFFCANGERKEP